MANRPKGYGYSRELADKLDAKYSDDSEMEVVEWIQSITEESPEGTGKDHFHKWLQDGTVLGKLMNHLQPNSCKINPPSTSSIAAMRKNKEMENVGNFLKAAEAYGVKSTDLFQTVDLYEKQNMAQVLSTLSMLSTAAIANGYTGPSIGVKMADRNPRNFDESKLREGRNIIGLQMGTNQVASQEGMSPYGLGRQLTPQSK